MLKKVTDKAKYFILKNRSTIRMIIFSLLIAYQTSPVMAYATDQYMKPINNLKTIFINIIGTAGLIVLGFGGVQFGTAFKKQDQGGEHDAYKTLIAGGIMFGISAFITALTT